MTIQSLRLFLLCVTALLALVVPTASRASDFKPAACVDNTPHKVRMVQVAPGAELEVLDWGGSGKAMVLLTGLGDNAHVYDQFAYQFTDYYHVIGITRRGFLPSSQPRHGYDVPTRAADVIAVLDLVLQDPAKVNRRHPIALPRRAHHLERMSPDLEVVRPHEVFGDALAEH